MDYFPQAVWASVIAQLHLVAGLQGPFGERLCESSCSNGSDFHTLSFLNRASEEDDPGFARQTLVTSCARRHCQSHARRRAAESSSG
jgi:hypothetical protein